MREYSYLDATPPGNGPLSVSDALSVAKEALESITLSVVGEISDLSDNPRYKAVYFTLADEGAALPCLMWRSAFDRLGIQLKSGMQVEVRGRFSVYSAKGRMQFDVRHMSLAGEGQLRAQVAALAAKLRSQGLMDESRKHVLPAIPEMIALITSPQGKAVHDVLRTLRRRFPLAKVLLFGVKVEGKTAPADIIQALKAAQASEAEVILLVRGGGSYEDLMPFNDEALARAIASARKPIITGVGHEPDTSIADMVASLRASTPTAAAEAAVPDTLELEASLSIRSASLISASMRYIERHRHVLEVMQQSTIFTQDRFLTFEYAADLDQTALRLDMAIPTGFAAVHEGIKDTELRLCNSMATILEEHSKDQVRNKQALIHTGSKLTASYHTILAAAAASMESLSPLAVLSRGYALSYDKRGSVVRSVKQIAVSDEIRVRLADGSIQAQVVSKEILE